MSSDITYCVSIGCPLRASCQRADYPREADVQYSSFAELPYDHDKNTCNYHLPKDKG